MAGFAFDCETNGLYFTVGKVHSLVVRNLETGEVFSCADQPGHTPITEGLRILSQADFAVGHNVIKYDVPVLQKIYPWWKPPERVIDTLVMSRLIWSDIRDEDNTGKFKNRVPPKLRGMHSLESWGYRLKEYKGDFGKATHNTKDDDVWAYWTQDMQDYCVQDVNVTVKLFRLIEDQNYSTEAIQIEHDFCTIIGMQERNGFSFNEREAALLYTSLVQRRVELRQELKDIFPNEVVEEEFIPKRDNRRLGYVKDVPFIKRRVAEFNPSSRQQIAKRLQALGWEPQEFTESGQPKIDESILEGIVLRFPQASLLAEHFLVEKRIGQLAEGEQAWLRLVNKGRIHGSVNTNGAVTGRCTHSNPNVAQVPKVGKPYGEECRALFGPRKGWVLVGVDLAGLELRCLAHFMARYDGGAYGRILLEGDIHWANTQAMGLCDEDRDDHKLAHKILRNGSKTFMYAYLYGCGDHKAGNTLLNIVLELRKAGLEWKPLMRKFFGVEDIPNDARIVAGGKKVKAEFLRKLPALAKLKKKIDETCKANNKRIRGLDGRLLKIRSSHASLNTLLQSAGALIAKLATIIAWRKLTAAGLLFGRDWALCAHIHDEVQIECKPGIAERVGKIVVESMQEAGRAFKFRLPIDGEWKVGNNWKDTH